MFMEVSGNIKKLRSEWDTPIQYWLPIGDQEIFLNDLIGKKISFQFTDNIHCVQCGKKTPKSFFQGFCYACFVSSPLASECILNPEKCEAHLGVSRDLEWSKTHCLKPHFVYLALSSGAKVGVTRKSQIPTRWIDQGASKAIKIAKTNNRNEAGQIEVALKAFISDKTAWQRMLKNEIGDIKLETLREQLKSKIPKSLQHFFLPHDRITELTYPHQEFPLKIKSISFDKESLIEGTLTAIKGQYLILNNQIVLNMRKHSGYEIQMTY